MVTITYGYLKKRKDFGAQPLFCESPPHLIDSINPDRALQKMYLLRNPVHQESQESKPTSEKHINTITAVMANTGCFHSEGGWPKDVNCFDEEQTLRYRRRVERDDDYCDAVVKSYSKFLYMINQNNAIAMYQMYFNDMPPLPEIDKSSIRFANTFRDPHKRPVACINWTPEDDPKLVAVYCNRDFPVKIPYYFGNTSFYVWNTEINTFPAHKFTPPSPCWQTDCSPTNKNLLIGGLEDGRYAVFDMRSEEPVIITPDHLAHREPVSSVVFMHSRTNTEVFGASSDGSIKWWDIRDVSQSTEEIILTLRIPVADYPRIGNSQPVSCLCYDRFTPTKFAAGTDTGFVITINRKGKTPQEMITSIKEAHNSAVKKIHRNILIPKIFLTCGDWVSNIWNDELHGSPILCGIPQRYQINDVEWLPNRTSGYAYICNDGFFRYWDLLRKLDEPYAILEVSQNPLTKMKFNEDGRLCAIGDTKGIVSIISLPPNLYMSGDNDKNIIQAAFERESKREHILESKLKEIKLKQQQKAAELPVPASELVSDEGSEKLAEEEYRRTVQDTIKRTGYSAAAETKKKATAKKR